jgi:hypothetical protein
MGCGEWVRWTQDLAVQSLRPCVVCDQPDAPVGLRDKDSWACLGRWLVDLLNDPCCFWLLLELCCCRLLMDRRGPGDVVFLRGDLNDVPETDLHGGAGHRLLVDCV